MSQTLYEKFHWTILRFVFCCSYAEFTEDVNKQQFVNYSINPTSHTIQSCIDAFFCHFLIAVSKAFSHIPWPSSVEIQLNQFLFHSMS